MPLSENAAMLCGQFAVHFGWRPQEFWDATPHEILSILAALQPDIADPPDSKLLAQLMETFPDG